MIADIDSAREDVRKIREPKLESISKGGLP